MSEMEKGMIEALGKTLKPLHLDPNAKLEELEKKYLTALQIGRKVENLGELPSAIRFKLLKRQLEWEKGQAKKTVEAAELASETKTVDELRAMAYIDTESLRLLRELERAVEEVEEDPYARRLYIVRNFITVAENPNKKPTINFFLDTLADFSRQQLDNGDPVIPVLEMTHDKNRAGSWRSFGRNKEDLRILIPDLRKNQGRRYIAGIIYYIPVNREVINVVPALQAYRRHVRDEVLKDLREKTVRSASDAIHALVFTLPHVFLNTFARIRQSGYSEDQYFGLSEEEVLAVDRESEIGMEAIRLLKEYLSSQK